MMGMGDGVRVRHFLHGKHFLRLLEATGYQQDLGSGATDGLQSLPAACMRCSEFYTKSELFEISKNPFMKESVVGKQICLMS